MRLSNFRLLAVKTTNHIDQGCLAVVDVSVSTGLLWWRRTQTETKRIRREYAGVWYFVDSGEYTPGMQAENLARAWDAQESQTSSVGAYK